ncbi:phosphoribosylanthranilate isomerase [Candidiatus Paracoxiella cheracis]|uniref:phosphoribosylanthranilate isomerase n=1 Tax=Candidiatus Paracoxiella cheracis TaxID=3405120 RepID=UPI003BF4F07A
MSRLRIIKICGITDPGLAAETVRLGAHYIGIIMYEHSKRYVNVLQAKYIAAAVKDAGGIPVAVFVDTPPHEIKSICKICDIDTVQLHGSISRKGHQYLPESFQRIYVMHVNDDGSLNPDADHGLNYLDKKRDFILFDGVKGGSGQFVNWNNFTYDGMFHYLVAGGLTPENVSSVISLLHPSGVDVSSGVEQTPGVKDKHLIKQFIDSAKQSTKHVVCNT